MILKRITNGQATVVLQADDCRFLAQACDTTADHTIAADSEAEVIRAETLAAAFKAIFATCHAQWTMTARDLTALDKILAQVGLTIKSEAQQ